MTTQQITFQIENFRVPTDKQKAIGIYGSFNINIALGNTVIATLAEAKLMRTKDNSDWYVESPYELYGNDSDKKRKRFWRMFPLKDDWDKKKALVQQAKEAYEQAEKNNPNNKTATQTVKKNSSLWPEI